MKGVAGRLQLATALAICASVAGMDKAGPSVAAPSTGILAVETFTRAPAYPFDGMIPEQNVPFLEGPEGARYHVSARGGKMMAATTYADRRSLLAIPTRFDPGLPGAAIVLFFHGNLATLRDVEGRQGVPRQLFASHLNAVLVAPQLAVDALDSSPGHFYDPGFLDKYLDEAEDHLVSLGKGRFSKETLASLPVLIVAYSGGYLATAFSLHDAQPGGRIRGVILLDALFGETQKFEDWIVRNHAETLFFSAYSKASSAQNATLETALRTRGVQIEDGLPRQLAKGQVVFVSVPGGVHNDFVTRAWAADPLRVILSCLTFGGRASAPCGR